MVEPGTGYSSSQMSVFGKETGDEANRVTAVDRGGRGALGLPDRGRRSCTVHDRSDTDQRARSSSAIRQTERASEEDLARSTIDPTPTSAQPFNLVLAT